MSQTQLFEAALGIKAPWYVQGVDFDAARRELTIAVDFVAGTRFPYPGVAGEHPAHDTQIKRPTCKSLEFLFHGGSNPMKPAVPSAVPYPDMLSRQQLGVKLWGQCNRRSSVRQPARDSGICQHKGGEGLGTSEYDQHM